MRHGLGYAAMASLLVAIAACKDNVDEPGTTSESENGIETKLNAIQRANLDRFNFDQFERDYARLREALISETPNNTLLAARDMSFDYLDSDDDDALSAAEYGIWKLAADRGVGKPTAGDLPDDKVREVVSSYFYHDQDGSLTLSEEEFREARLDVDRSAPDPTQ